VIPKAEVEVVTPEVDDGGEADGLSRLDAAWDKATDQARAELVLGHLSGVRGIIATDVRKTCAAILARPDLGDERAYFAIFPDLPSEAQAHTLQQAARKFSIER
jgi:hypothetical protein